MSFGTLAGFAGGLLQTGIDYQTNLYNLKQQEDALEWNKEMQFRSWDREDSAIRRRVNDLKQAGLSPVLAAGSAAQASSPIQVSGSRLDKTNVVGNILQSVLASKNIEQINAGIAQTEQQAKLISAQVKGQQIANKINKRDYELSVSSGTSSRPSAFGSIVRDSKGMFDNIKSKIQSSTGGKDLPTVYKLESTGSGKGAFREGIDSIKNVGRKIKNKFSK